MTDDEWFSVRETAAWLSDSEAMAEVREADEAEERGETYSLEQVIAEREERRQM